MDVDVVDYDSPPRPRKLTRTTSAATTDRSDWVRGMMERLVFQRRSASSLRLSRDRSRPRVEAVVHGAQVSARQMRVNLGSSDVGVAEHGLYGAQVRPAFHQMRRE